MSQTKLTRFSLGEVNSVLFLDSNCEQITTSQILQGDSKKTDDIKFFCKSYFLKVELDGVQLCFKQKPKQKNKVLMYV